MWAIDITTKTTSRGQQMDMNSVVERIEWAITIGNAKKDFDTNYRILLFSSSSNTPLVHHNWIGDSGQKVADDWMGAGAEYNHGQVITPWKNDFDEWRAANGGRELTLGDLKGGKAQIEIKPGSDDHFNFSPVVWAKLRGQAALVALSPNAGGVVGIASDGANGWPEHQDVALSLIT